ncbi:MAG: hypothetical protein AAGE52_18030 [Myxococcota bacterium]
MRLRAAAMLALCVFAEVLLLTAALDRHRSHGFRARWAAIVDGDQRPITETFEPRVWFRNELRPLDRIVRHWPSDLAIPAEIPVIDAEFEATLTVPEGRPRVLEVDSSGSVVLSVDGEEVQFGSEEDPLELAPGRYRLLAQWGIPSRPRWTDRIDTHFRFRWGYPNGRSVTIPPSAFTPMGAVPHRTLTWILGVFLALLLSGGTFWSARARGEVRAKRSYVLAVGILVLLGMGLRLYEYSAAPDFRESAAELRAAWNGVHVLAGTQPDDEIRFWGEQPVVVGASQTPLFDVLVGGAARMGGASEAARISLAHTRVVPLFLSFLALVLCIAVARQLSGSRAAALFAGMLCAVTPMVVLQSRVGTPDALLAVLLLAVVLALARYQREGGRGALVTALGCGCLAPFAAPSGLAIAYAVVMVAAASKRRTHGAVALLAALVPTVYVLSNVSADDVRVSFDVFSYWFYGPAINGSRIGRGPLMFLWTAAVIIAPRLSERTSVVLPTGLFLLATALSVGTTQQGSHLLPVLLVLCALAGPFVVRVFKRPDLLGGLLVVGMLTLYALMLTFEPAWIANRGHWPAMRRITWGVALGLLTPLGLTMVFPHRWTQRLARASIGVALLIYATASAHFVLRYDVTSELYRNYDFGAPGVPTIGGRRDPFEGQ